MAWLICSLIAGFFNILLMQMFAASQLGPTPVLLPLLLAGVSLILVLGSIIFAGIQKRKNSPHCGLTALSAAIWAAMVAYNLWVLNGVLMVA